MSYQNYQAAPNREDYQLHAKTMLEDQLLDQVREALHACRNGQAKYQDLKTVLEDFNYKVRAKPVKRN